MTSASVIVPHPTVGIVRFENKPPDPPARPLEGSKKGFFGRGFSRRGPPGASRPLLWRGSGAPLGGLCGEPPLTSLELIPIPKIDKPTAMTILGMRPQKQRESLRSAPGEGDADHGDRDMFQAGDGGYGFLVVAGLPLRG